MCFADVDRWLTKNRSKAREKEILLTSPCNPFAGGSDELHNTVSGGSDSSDSATNDEEGRQRKRSSYSNTYIVSTARDRANSRFHGVRLSSVNKDESGTWSP